MIKKIRIDVHKNTAFTEEFGGLALTAIDAETAVKELMDKCRARQKSELGLYTIQFELPYLGQKFIPHWDEMKRPKGTRGEDDEFEAAQKIPYKLQKGTI